MKVFRNRAIVVLLIASFLIAIAPSGVRGAPPMDGPIVHVVRWGENLTRIAARYGVGVYDIAQANQLLDPNRIYVGQRLVIPVAPGVSPVPASGVEQYVVKTGDTLSALAVRFRTTVAAIVQANGLVNPSYITIGQVLLIPTSGSTTPSAGVYYTVRAGDTLAGIAYRYGVGYWSIVQANNLSNPSLIYTGQTLYIPGGVAPSGEPTATPTPTPTTAPGSTATPTPTATPKPTTAPVGDPVHGWVGKLYALPAGAQYDDYFENPNGDRFGIQALNAATTDAILAKRGTDRTVYVWGTLLRDVPDVNGVQIAATHIEEATTVDIDWVGTIVAFAAGAQYDDYFRRESGERYGITSSDDAIAALIAQARSDGSTVRITGTLTTNAPDAYNSQVAVTGIQVSPEPGEPTPTPTAVPEGKCAIPAKPIIPSAAVSLPAPFPPKPLWMASPEYGMTVNVWGMGECITERDLGLVADAGFGWVRQMFRWRDIEVAKGVFEWNEADRIVAAAAAHQLDLAVAVAYQPAWAGGGYPLNGPPDNMADFAEFMGALAQRYRGLVRAYEIWPGPNVSENWGGGSPQPHRYAEMLNNGYWYVKDQDPFAMVITGGLVQTADHDAKSIPPWDFFTTLYQHTGAATSSDVWGVQAYGFKAAPEQSPQELSHPDWNNAYPATAERNTTWGFRSVEVLHDWTLPPDKPIMKQWVVTEMGWTTNPNARSWVHWAATTEQVKADYVRRAYVWAKEQWSDWVGVIFVPLTDARLTTADEGYWWAIVEPDGDPRPAYDALKAMSK